MPWKWVAYTRSMLMRWSTKWLTSLLFVLFIGTNVVNMKYFVYLFIQLDSLQPPTAKTTVISVIELNRKVRKDQWISMFAGIFKRSEIHRIRLRTLWNQYNLDVKSQEVCPAIVSNGEWSKKRWGKASEIGKIRQLFQFIKGTVFRKLGFDKTFQK